MSQKRQGLRRPSPDLIAKARDDTATQVTRILLTFVGTAVFCALSLLTPDSALLAGNEKVTVPLAGPVSFFGFVLLGPAVLVVLRVYLQIYVEHERRLDRIARRIPMVRAPTLLPLKNPLMQSFGGFAFYLLLPLMALLFTWKAAVFPGWGSGLFCVAVAVTAGHLVLPLRKLSWRQRTLFSAGAVILSAGLMIPFGLVQRPFHLFRANLSDQSLPNSSFRRADLGGANLGGAILIVADLRDADPRDAIVGSSTYFTPGRLLPEQGFPKGLSAAPAGWELYVEGDGVRLRRVSAPTTAPSSPPQ